MIFYKKEKFALAETHFKKALAINPQSAVLLCHVGLVGCNSDVFSVAIVVIVLQEYSFANFCKFMLYLEQNIDELQ